MRTVNLRAAPLYFASVLALVAGCSDNGSGIPNQGNGDAGKASGTAGVPSTAGSGSSSATAGAAPGEAGASSTSGAAGAATAGSGGVSGSAGSSVGGGGTAGAAGMPMMEGFARPKGQLPNAPRDASMVGVDRAHWKDDLLSPTFLFHHHIGQHIVLNGYLGMMGNEEFWFYDITDPLKPTQMSEFKTPNRDPVGGPKKEGEAESHTVSMAKYGDKTYLVTTGGHGVDTWDVTDQTSVKHVQQIKLEGVAYGDFTAAVWGLSWQGNYIYVGGTDTGVHILDAHDPTNVTFVKRIPTGSLGNVSAGPLDAIGNVLVITTPKESAGIATLDISDPVNPFKMGSIQPKEKSYIGQFYKHYVFLQSPLRAWDVLTDPYKLGGAETPIGSLTTAGSEYMSFADDFMFLGHLRPNGGASKIDVSDPAKMAIKDRIWGRLDQGDINDDQFTLQIGNLLVMGDDEAPYAGAIIGVHATAPDKVAPKVDTLLPRDKATGLSVKSRIGVSFTDNIELATVTPASFIVRPVGGEPIKGVFGIRQGVVNFSPSEDLKPGTTYEVVLPKGGICDLVQNSLAEEFKSTFTTK